MISPREKSLFTKKKMNKTLFSSSSANIFLGKQKSRFSSQKEDIKYVTRNDFV